MGLLNRVRDLVRRHAVPTLGIDDPGLEVVAEAFDPAEADSAVLARARDWRAGDPAVLRHHLTLPAPRFDEAARTLAQDGWKLREAPTGSPTGTVSPSDTVVRAHALRVQVLDPLHCAQERSRMAGLAQRLGGDSLGWDALQPARPGGRAGK